MFKGGIGDARCKKIGSHWYASSTPPIREGLNLEHLDNTNADHETRAVWVQLAQRFAVPIRCVHFPAPVKLCQHNDTVRALSASKFNPEKRTILPHSAFAGFQSRFKEPKANEGFEDVVRVEFQVKRWLGKRCLSNSKMG